MDFHCQGGFFFGQGAHQLPLHDFPHVHEVVDEAILLPVNPVDFPIELALPLPLMLLVYSFLHLTLKVQDDFLYQCPALSGTAVRYYKSGVLRHPIALIFCTRNLHIACMQTTK
jgi:hypothetical protein